MHHHHAARSAHALHLPPPHAYRTTATPPALRRAGVLAAAVAALFAAAPTLVRAQVSGLIIPPHLAGGSYSYAQGVSADGAVVVGVGDTTAGTRAFRWTQAVGMQTVADWLRAAGATVANDAAMGVAKGTNSDGSVVVGEGENEDDTFIARVAPVGSGMITLADVSQSLYSAARAGDMVLGSTNLVLNGAHSRPLARRVAASWQKTF